MKPVQQLLELCQIIWPLEGWQAFEWYLKPDIQRHNVWALDRRLFTDSMDSVLKILVELDEDQIDRFEYQLQQTQLRNGDGYGYQVLTLPTKTIIYCLYNAIILKIPRLKLC